MSTVSKQIHPEWEEEQIEAYEQKQTITPKSSKLVTPFNTVSMKDITSKDYGQDRWLWREYLPGDGALVIMSAYPKVGKSTFIYRLALAIARGDEFLNQPTEQTRILFLALEERERDVAARLKRFGANDSDPIDLVTTPVRDSKKVQDYLRQLIKERGYGLLIVDTLSRFWTVKDENSNREVEQAMTPLLDLAHETGCTCLYIHHESKFGGSDGKGLRGASSLFGTVDSLWTYARTEKRTSRSLSVNGRYPAPPDREIDFDVDREEFRLLGDITPTKSKKTQIHELLKTGWFSVKAMEAQGFSGSTFDRAKDNPPIGWCIEERHGEGRTKEWTLVLQR